MSSGVLVAELAASPLTGTELPTPDLGDPGGHRDVADVKKGSLSQGSVTLPETERNETDQQLVDFDGPQDASNPINWSKGYKWTIVILLSTVNIVGYVSTMLLD